MTWGLWPDQDRGPWQLGLYWAEVAGRIECVGMELRSVPRVGEEEPPGSRWRGTRHRPPDVPEVLTSMVLRDLPIGRIVQGTKQSQAVFRRWWASREKERRRELVGRAEAWEAGRHAGGPRGYGFQHFEEVAAIYRRALEAPDPATGTGRAKPTAAVAEHFGVSKSAAAKWVARARTMDLLPPARRGQR